MKIQPQQIDPSIPCIECVSAIHSPDGDQSKTVYRYRIALPDLPPHLIEGYRGDIEQSVQLWLSSVQEQHPEYFQEPRMVAFRHKYGKYLQELRERMGKTIQEVKSEMFLKKQ